MTQLWKGEQGSHPFGCNIGTGKHERPQMRETGNIFQILIGNRGVIQIKLTQISKFYQQGELRVFQGHSAKIQLHYLLAYRLNFLQGSSAELILIEKADIQRNRKS